MIRRALRRLWDSPTFATWLNQAAQLSRLLIIIPLVLARFNATETAAWLLFGAINVFGNIVHGRLATVFSRMIAFALAGATDLSPISNSSKGANKAGSESNWGLIRSCYHTLGRLQLFTALLSAVVSWAMGCYALKALLHEYPRREEIEVSFAIFLITNAIVFAGGKYAVTLIGLNRVAIINQYNAVFAFISVAAGIGVLLLGGKIVALSLVMQGIVVVGIARNRFILRRDLEGRKIFEASSEKWDWQIISWAWIPTIRSTASLFLGNGLIQISGIVATRYCEPAVAASYLLAMRLVSVITSLADTPFYSRVPQFARWLAEGRRKELGEVIPRRIQMACLLQAMGYCIVGATAGPSLHILDTHTQFVSFWMWTAIGVSMVLSHFPVLALTSISIGNHFALALHQFLLFLAGAIAMVPLFKLYGLWGLILSLTLPGLALIPFGAIRVSAEFVEMSSYRYAYKSLAVTMILFAVGILLGYVVNSGLEMVGLWTGF